MANEAPKISGLRPSASFNENLVNATPQLIDSAVIVTDADGNLGGGTLRVTGLLAEDRVFLQNQGSGAGQVGLLVLSNQTQVTVGGSVVGKISGSGQGEDFAIDLATGVTDIQVQQLTQALTYANVSNTPTASRELRLDLTDAEGAHANLAATGIPVTIGVNAQNDAPLFASPATASIAENSTGIAYQARAADPEGSAVSYSLSGTDAALFRIDAATGAVRILTLPDFEAPADADGDGIYQITVNASDGSLTRSQAVALSVTNANENPVLSGFATTVTLGENAINAAAALIDDAVTLTDPEGNWAGGSLLLGPVSATESLGIRDEGTSAGQIGISGTTVSFGGVAFASWSGGSGAPLVVNFTAAAGTAAVERLIENLTYANSSDTPAPSRQLTLTLRDGSGAKALLGDAVPAYVDQTSSFLPAANNLPNNEASPIASRVALGNVFGDAHPDLLVGNVFGPVYLMGNDAGVLRGVESTSFLAFRNDGSFRPYSAPGIGDLDGDGDLDIAVALDEFMYRYINEGGTFTSIGAFTLPGAVTGLVPAMADLDRDGLADLIIGTPDGLVFLRNTGGANFAAFAPGQNPLESAAGRLGAPALGDIDGDGRLDLLLAVDGSIQLVLNTVSGLVEATGAANPFQGISGVYSLAFGDLNLDGVGELVTGSLAGALAILGRAVPVVTVAVTPEGEKPVITSAAERLFPENASFNAYALTVTDVDSSAYVAAISGADAELFEFRTGPNISAFSRVIFFKEAPDFEQPRDADGDNVYTFTVHVTDLGPGGSETVTKTVSITVTNVDERASFTGLDAGVTLAEAGLPGVLDGDVSFSDPDGTYAGRTLTVSGQLAGDQLGFAATGGISVSGSSVLYQGTAFATFSGGPGSSLSVQFGAGASSAAVDALVQALTFSGAAGQRTLTLSFDEPFDPLAATITVTVLADGGDPLITSAPYIFVPENTDFAFYAATAITLDGAAPTWSLSGTDAARFTIDAATGLITFITPPDFEAPDDVGGDAVYDLELNATDANGTSSRILNVLVDDVNEAPRLLGLRPTLVLTQNGLAGGPALLDDAVEAFDPEGLFQFDNNTAGRLPALLVNGLAAGDVVALRTNGTPLNLPFSGSPDLIGWQGRGLVANLRENQPNGFALDLTRTDFGRDIMATLIENLTFTTTSASPAFARTLTFTLSDIGLNGDSRAPQLSSSAAAGDTTTLTVYVLAGDGEVRVASGAATAAEGTMAVVYDAMLVDALGRAPPESAITWSISGADAARFDLDPATGQLRFHDAPDFEAPADAEANNQYVVTLTGSLAIEGGTRQASREVVVTVTDVNDAPGLAGFGPVLSVQQDALAAPVLLDASVVVADPENSFEGGALVLSGAEAGDHLGIRHQGSGEGQIGVAGNQVTFGGVAFGTVSGGEGTALKVLFGAGATNAAVDALIQNLTFASANAVAGDARDLTLRLADRGGLNADGNIVDLFLPYAPGADPFTGLSTGFDARPAFIDVDGDGLTDLVSNSTWPVEGGLALFRNTGDGFDRLTGAANPLEGYARLGGLGVAVGDVDGDGVADLVIGAGEFDTPFVARRTGDGFEPMTGAADPFRLLGAVFGLGQPDVLNPALVDLDDDGWLDLVTGGNYGTLRAFRNDRGTFMELTGAANPFAAISVPGQAYDAYSAPRFHDFDGDGRLDLLLGDNYGLPPAVYRDTGTGYARLDGIGGPLGTVRGFVDVGNRSPNFFDIDGDGRDDLVFGYSNGNFQALRNSTLQATLRVEVTEAGPGPIARDAPGLLISLGSGGVPPGTLPSDEAVPVAALALIETSPIQLEGEAFLRARIENTDGWNAFKNLLLDSTFWQPAMGTKFLLANFVDVRWDLAAQSAGFDIAIAGAKRGLLELGGGDDLVSWIFQSNERNWLNTATIEAGEGDDRVLLTDIGTSTLDNALLADNAAPTNGALWNASYDGRHSTADVRGGAGNDVIEVAAASRVRLLADGGAGNDTITGGRGADRITGGSDDDVLTGRQGADRFGFGVADGIDQITDFSAADGDKVGLANSASGATLVLAGDTFLYGSTQVTATNGHVFTTSDFILA